jgi:hypothetical protein
VGTGTNISISIIAAEFGYVHSIEPTFPIWPSLARRPLAKGASYPDETRTQSYVSIVYADFSTFRGRSERRD